MHKPDETILGQNYVMSFTNPFGVEEEHLVKPITLLKDPINEQPSHLELQFTSQEEIDQVAAKIEAQIQATAAAAAKKSKKKK